MATLREVAAIAVIVTLTSIACAAVGVAIAALLVRTEPVRIATLY